MSAKTVKVVTKKAKIKTLKRGAKISFTCKGVIEEIVGASTLYPTLNGDLKVVRIKCISGPYAGQTGLQLAMSDDELDREVAPSFLKRFAEWLASKIP